MRFYIVLAHPEPQSLNSSLAFALQTALKEAGHEVRLRDLHKDNFNPLLTRADFPNRRNVEHVQFPAAQVEASASNNISLDVAQEQDNLIWADAVILQFPLWLYSMPAILKGWCERVLSEGFAYQPARNLWFENGSLAGTRLLLSITTSGRAETFTKRGRHGSLDIILWPIMNGFWFSGFDLVRPFVAFNVVRASLSRRRTLIRSATESALSIGETPILPVHSLKDYDSNGLLKSGIQPVTAGQQAPDKLARGDKDI